MINATQLAKLKATPSFDLLVVTTGKKADFRSSSLWLIQTTNNILSKHTIWFLKVYFTHFSPKKFKPIFQRLTCKDKMIKYRTFRGQRVYRLSEIEFSTHVSFSDQFNLYIFTLIYVCIKY